MANITNVRFLVVDDSPAMRRIVKALLATFGARFIQDASNGVDALNLMKSSPADIIITDCKMPDLNGVDFVRRLRAQEAGTTAMTPVIMLTAYSSQAFVVAARDAGVTEFCTKPVTAMNLWKRIVAVVDKPRPFVRGGRYAGPCRRRRVELYGGDGERRTERVERNDEIAGLRVRQLVAI